MTKALVRDYNKKKREINNRLKEFSRLGKAGDKDIFSELCFCLLTPQSKAVYCDEAVKTLKNTKVLFWGCNRRIRKYLQRVRFPNNKAKYLAGARKFFQNSAKQIDIKTKLNPKDPQATRGWLVKNVKGLGYKEASHFLRNIGMGENLAILDVHILRNLKKYGVIDTIPPSITKKAYLEIEKKMQRFAKKVNIPLGCLDLLFWSSQTGFIFK
ncbi:MAG: N-glycosylase/DNA lyase [Candidatus Omnitrophota bacterium]